MYIATLIWKEQQYISHHILYIYTNINCILLLPQQQIKNEVRKKNFVKKGKNKRLGLLYL